MPRFMPALLRFISVLATILLLSFAVSAQTTCSPNNTLATVHAEGLAERIGDITITCTGGTALQPVSLTLYITLNTNITNRLDLSDNPIGITVTGPVTASVRSGSATSLSLSPVTYTVPAAPATPVTFTISGIRAAVAPLASGGATAAITATILGVGATFPPQSSLLVATSAPSLLSSQINNGVPCNGSPLPATLDFAAFASTSTSSTVRVSEASLNAFNSADIGADSGLRIRVNISGYGAGARVFAPNAITGNSSSSPTSAGAYASSMQGGTYTPAVNQLLLVRVNGADSAGVGGSLVMAKPASVTPLSALSEVSLTNGAGYAVYEVLDSNPAVAESAQIPLFVVVNQTNCPSTLQPQLSPSLAPVSTVAIATNKDSDAVPRFVASTPGLDCQSLGDCTAPYFPKFMVDQTALSFTGTSLGAMQSAFLRVGNTGSGILNFTTSVAYASGSGWLSVSPSSGANNATLQVIADPSKLTEGAWSATLTVDAGLYGKAAIPVTFNVGPVGVVIQSVGNAASFTYGTVAPGSYAVIYGLNFKGKNVGVTFNSLPGSIVYAGDKQINAIVPSALSAQLGASVVVTVDGLVSNSFKVNLLLNSPGIFTPGMINFDDGAVNSATHPVKRGSYIEIYLTGLAIPLTGQVTVNIGDQTNLIPQSPGATQILPALDQVNIIVPSSLPSMTPVPLKVCIPGTTGQQVCSNAVDLYLQ